MCLGSRSARFSEIIVFPSTDESYCVVLRCFSIFPTLPGLQAKDRRKSTCVSEMFALKLGNLTKIILKTLWSVRHFLVLNFCAIFDAFVIIRISHFFLTSFWVQFSRLWWVVQTTFELG